MQDRVQEQLPLACSAGVFSASERERWNELRIRWRKRVQEVEELPDGYAFRLSLDRAALLEIAEWIGFERLCCPFLEFALLLEPRAGSSWLRLTGPAGVKDVLRPASGRER